MLIRSYHAVPELEEVLDMDTVFGPHWIFYFDEVQQFNLGPGLISVLLIVLDYLECHWLAFLVVHALKYLPE